MKTFFDLSKEQQASAVAFAKKELLEHLKDKVILPEEKLSDNEINMLALAAAEGSNYDENGKAILEEVPTYYLGGCV